MSSLILAIKAFFRTLANREFRSQVDQLLRGGLPAASAEVKPSEPAELPTIVERKRPARSEALTLLAALQREARLVDFLREPISSYSDAQIGAAVRDIHRDCAAVLERMFGIQPLLTDEEGAPIEVPAGFDAARFSLTGAVSGQAPYHGTLAHHGWQATRCFVPQWSGSSEAANIVAPAVVELK
jgi:hypothetical protein